MAADDSTKIIEKRTFLVRGYKVMLLKDLAEFYGVTVTALNKSLKANTDRFPEDFMFQITREEAESIGIDVEAPAKAKAKTKVKSKAKAKAKTKPRVRKVKLPIAFTENGVAMMSSVLDSKRAIEVNKALVRSFVKL